MTISRQKLYFIRSCIALIVLCCLTTACANNTSGEQPAPTESPAVSEVPTLSPEEIEAALDPNSPANNELIVSEPSNREIHELQRDKQLAFALTESVLKPGETIGYTISNETSSNLNFGDEFALEKLVDGIWHKAGFKIMTFNSIGYLMGANQSFENVIPLTQELPAGTYRLVKEVSLEDPEQQEKITLISGDLQIE